MNEALIKATFFLSVLSTENPAFPSVPLIRRSGNKSIAEI
jgi:hypothetical protein